MTPAHMRALAVALAAFALTALAAPPLYTLVSDALDADAPAATLPGGPVEQALETLAREQPKATVLEPLRTGEQAGQRYALAAWRSAPNAKDWDAILVVATPAGARTLEISSTHKDRAAALEALIAYGTSGAAPVAVAKPAAPAASLPLLPLPTAWEPRFVLLYAPNPAYRPGDAVAEAALSDAHVQYALRLQDEGRALAAGPISSSGTSSGSAAEGAAIGMTLLRVRDLAAAESIAKADPAVVAGRLLVTVREWKVPAGRLR